MTRSKLGTVKQIETTLQVLATFSEEREGDGQLRDAIAVVRYELDAMTDRSAKRERALEFIRVDICTAIENGAVDDEIRAVVETAITDAIRSLA